MNASVTRACALCFQDVDSRASFCGHCGQRQPDAPGLHRDLPGRALAGVCAAFAHHFGWDVTLMRIAFVASVAVTGGLVFWVYLAAWLMTPFAARDRAPLLRFVDGVGRLISPPQRAQPQPLEPQ
jgi:phage shock protein C